MSAEITERLEKQQAAQLLSELNNIKGPGKLPAWNIKAQTFLVFAAARRHCQNIDEAKQ